VSARIALVRIAVAAQIILPACQPHEGSFILELADCRLDGSAMVAGASSSFTGCRAYYGAETEVLTLQLVTEGTSGSFLEPGPGWLAMSVDSRESAPATLRVETAASAAPVPVQVPRGTSSVTYRDESMGQVPASGRISLSRFTFSRDQKRLEAEANLDGVQIGGGAGSRSLGGGFSLQAAATAGSGSGKSPSPTTTPPPTGGQTSGGSGGCADNGASCTKDPTVVRWQSQCQGQIGQAACYCAAAATYACFLKNGCYREAGKQTNVTRAQLEMGIQSESDKAKRLGTSCNVQ
jgi:hypothetical protein